MKRYGNLFSKIVDLDNITLAHKNAKKGKNHYAEVQEVEKDPERCIQKIQDMLINKTFTTAKYKTKLIHEPKERIIYKLPYFPDRIVHHAVMNVIQPIWDNVFIYDLYSAIPCKGLHAGVLRLRQFLKDKENTKYCLKFDVKNYYPSVNHDILFELVKRKIKCKDTLWLLEDVIRSPDGNTNLPIGNYLSQYFGNIYLNWFDHWLKEKKEMKYYVRYCDDGCLLHKSKEALNNLLEEIKIYLNEKLYLELNPKTQIFPIDARGIDFLGYRSFRNYTLLRKSSATRFKHKIRFIEQNHEKLKPQHIISSLMSYCGWIQFCNGHHLLKKYILENDSIIEIMNEASKTLNTRNPILKLTN
ncbi:MAG: reverse transcriptase [Methanomicrobia archaeon]|nr:reverse transcriptase [Methanomicrobia archaeon]